MINTDTVLCVHTNTQTQTLCVCYIMLCNISVFQDTYRTCYDSCKVTLGWSGRIITLTGTRYMIGTDIYMLQGHRYMYSDIHGIWRQLHVARHMYTGGIITQVHVHVYI